MARTPILVLHGVVCTFGYGALASSVGTRNLMTPAIVRSRCMGSCMTFAKPAIGGCKLVLFLAAMDGTRILTSHALLPAPHCIGFTTIYRTLIGYRALVRVAGLKMMTMTLLQSLHGVGITTGYGTLINAICMWMT